MGIFRFVRDALRPGWAKSSAQARIGYVLTSSSSYMLNHLIRNDPDAEVRILAIERLREDFFHQWPDPRYALERVSLDDPDQTVRLKAIEIMTAPDFSMQIAERDGSYRFEVESRIQKHLRKVASSTSDERIMDRILPHLGWDEQQEILANLVISGADTEATQAAMARVVSAFELARVARSCASRSIQMSALARLRDDPLLAEVASSVVDETVALAALERVRGDAELVKVAIRASSSQVGLAAVARVNDESRLVEIASQSCNPVDVRLAAQEKVSGTPALVALSNRASDSAGRMAAASRVEDQLELVRLAMNASDRGVRRLALDRISDHTSISSFLASAEGPSLDAQRRCSEAERRFFLDSQNHCDSPHWVDTLERMREELPALRAYAQAAVRRSDDWTTRAGMLTALLTCQQTLESLSNSAADVRVKAAARRRLQGLHTGVEPPQRTP